MSDLHSQLLAIRYLRNEIENAGLAVLAPELERYPSIVGAMADVLVKTHERTGLSLDGPVAGLDQGVAPSLMFRSIGFLADEIERFAGLALARDPSFFDGLCVDLSGLVKVIFEVPQLHNRDMVCPPGWRRCPNGLCVPNCSPCPKPTDGVS